MSENNEASEHTSLLEKLRAENKALKASMDELLEASKAMRINLKCVAMPTWDEAIQKAEALKESK